MFRFSLENYLKHKTKMTVQAFNKCGVLFNTYRTYCENGAADGRGVQRNNVIVTRAKGDPCKGRVKSHLSPLLHRPCRPFTRFTCVPVPHVVHRPCYTKTLQRRLQGERRNGVNILKKPE